MTIDNGLVIGLLIGMATNIAVLLYMANTISNKLDQVISRFESMHHEIHQLRIDIIRIMDRIEKHEVKKSDD